MKNEKITSLTREQCEFAIQQVCKWMNICEDNKRGTGGPDVSHSALLRRMMMGGAIHENPPPTRLSYPAWELVEQEEIQIQDFWESDNRTWEGDEGLHEGSVVVVDQHAGYAWVDKEKKIIKHVRLGIEYQYFERETMPVWVHDGKPENHKYIGKFLRRLNDPPTGKEEIWNG